MSQVLHALSQPAGVARLDQGRAAGVGRQQAHALSPTWHLGSAIRYAESIGCKGFYTIEVSEDPAVRVIYSAILGGLA